MDRGAFIDVPLPLMLDVDPLAGWDPCRRPLFGWVKQLLNPLYDGSPRQAGALLDRERVARRFDFDVRP